MEKPHNGLFNECNFNGLVTHFKKWTSETGETT